MNNRNLRNFIFGVEDSLVSTVGLLSGVAIVGTSIRTIILAGVVLIFVEAFSMGVGSLLSENSEDEYVKKEEVPLKNSFLSSFIMFISYFVSGFIPLSPYFIFNTNTALPASIGVSLVALFVLGYFSARLSGLNKIRKGSEMLLIGGIAIGLGATVGILINIL